MTETAGSVVAFVPETVSQAILDSRPTQIQAVSQPGDSNCGPHVQLFALCEDGSIWCQYHSSGFSNVPTDRMWYLIQPPEGFRRTPSSAAPLP